MLTLRAITVLTALASLSACAGAPGIAGSTSNAKLVQGPPITDIVTPFDEALTCLNGKIAPQLVFSVGAVVDQTGKESFTDGGVGKFVTQGAGDMIQSALFKAGTTVVNRRDPRVSTTEAEWRIRDLRQQLPSSFYITGSINSLDFIPGSGVDAEVAGIGARYRQNRMLIGLDLAMTQANTGRIVANVPLHKQIFASEAGVSTGRFFGETLVLADIGGREREAVHFALRQMLNLATFELLTQVMKVENYVDCREMIDRAHGYIDNTKTAEAIAAVNVPTPPPAITATGAPAAGAPVVQASTSPGEARKDTDFQASSGNFAASNGSGEDISAQARAQALLAN